MWYKDGLKFKCTGCGACCSKEPGYVFLSEEDISRLSGPLGLERATFLKTYTRLVHGRYSLLEKPNYDCIFLQNNRCTLYQARPKQCRTFPFWQENLVSKAAWEAAGKSCEGINHPDANTLTVEEIQTWKSS